MFITRTFERPVAEDRFRVLPHGVRVEEIVHASRVAGIAFVTRAAFGFGRIDLARWGLGEYEEATAYSRGSAAAPRLRETALDEVAIELAVKDARDRVLRMVHAARTTWRAPTFARDMIDFRLVIQIYDRDGGEAYAPAAFGDMRLVDRVASLFIADFLSRKDDYDHVVSCDTCGDVTIGGHARHASWCIEPPTHSGIVERTRPSRMPAKRITLRGVGT
jgi:hypothetical protein